jgi:AcrR family transcriptional regulator
MNATATTRLTAEERREAILEAALVAFADHGAHGMSTEAVAKAVGISQPYIFRLFGTKKELVKATIERCLRGTLEMFRTAAAGLSGEDVFHAIGVAYRQRLTNPVYLRAQMQSYVAAEDPELRDVVRKGFGELVEYVERASGRPPEEIARFFASGMLLNVVASMDLLEADEGWARRLLEGCKEPSP